MCLQLTHSTYTYTYTPSPMRSFPLSLPPYPASPRLFPILTFTVFALRAFTLVLCALYLIGTFVYGEAGDAPRVGMVECWSGGIKHMCIGGKISTGGYWFGWAYWMFMAGFEAGVAEFGRSPRLVAAVGILVLARLFLRRLT